MNQKIHKQQFLIRNTLLTGLFLLLTPLPVLAAGIVAQAVKGADALTVTWRIQGAHAQLTTKVALEGNGVPIAASSQLLAPDASLPVCYLFMTDTSLSMKRQLKREVVPLLTALVAAKAPQYHYAIARFDTDLRMLTPFDADQAALQEAVDGLELQGNRTELYRAALSGLKELAQCQADRRVLVMLSDGDAEDDPAAYKLEDVVAAANTQDVPILTVGFNDSIKLQFLSRLSDDTGGRHWRFNKDLIDSLPGQLAEATDNGGRLVAALENIPFDTAQLLLNVTLADGTKLKTTLAIEPISAPAPAPAPTPWWQSRYFYLPLWVWLLGIASLGMILLLVLPRRRGEEQADAAEPYLLEQPLAAIHFDGQEFFMDRRTVNIGALPENDLVVDDPTVSRQQATIDYRDGEFHLTDRGSTNASLVNGVSAQHHQLQNGDILQFGDWRGEFEILQNHPI